MIAKVKEIFNKVVQIETLRYKKKGLTNIIIALFLLWAMFAIAPIVGKQIWPAHVEDKDFFMFSIMGLLSFGGTFIYFFQYLPGYLGVKWYKKYQIESDIKKPWEREDWQVKKKWSIIYFLFNKLIILPLYLGIGFKVAGNQFNFDMEFPTSWVLFSTIIKVMIVDDFIYMLFHRAFHEIPFLYKFHKVHHTCEVVISINGEYCHPFEQVVGNILPATISFSFFKAHPYTFFVWTAYKLYMSSEGHSSYEFPWTPFRILPFIYGSSYHDFHHTKNVGNYATSFYISELILGTNTVFFDREIKLFEKQQKLQAANASNPTIQKSD